MKHLFFIITILFINSDLFSQTQVENIKKGYLICFGTIPDAMQIAQNSENKKMNVTSVGQVISYFNDYIFKNRETIQRDLIRRAYFSLYKIQPDDQDVEQFYNSTVKRSKNFTELINELNIYFTSDINEPD